MILEAYAVYDEKALAYLTPFFTPTEGVAVRAFRQAVMDPGHDFSRHAEDYVLFRVGEFDAVDGALRMEPAPRMICTALTARALNTEEGK